MIILFWNYTDSYIDVFISSIYIEKPPALFLLFNNAVILIKLSLMKLVLAGFVNDRSMELHSTIRHSLNASLC